MSHKADCKKEGLLVSGYIRNLKLSVIAHHSSSTSTVLINSLCTTYYRSCIDQCISVEKELSKLYDSKNDAEKIWGIKKYIKKCVENVNKSLEYNDRNNCTLLVMSLIHIHSNISEIVSIKFGNAGKYKKAMIEQFQSLINKDILIMFAYYIHINLKQRGNSHGHCILNDIDNTLNELFIIYSYTVPIYNYNPFDLYYKTYLEARLLKNISIIQYEQILIKKYQNYTSYHVGYRLEKMVYDEMESMKLSTKFKEKYDGLRYEMNVTVCTPDIWPLFDLERNNDLNISNINKPNEIEIGCNEFIDFYGSNPLNVGKKLKFMMNGGDAMIEIDFNDKTQKTLIVSTYQMILLLCFNDGTIWSFLELLNMTNINRKQLEKVIISLCHPKVKILNKKPNRSQIKDDDIFCINSNYENKNNLVRVPVLLEQNQLNYRRVLVDNEKLSVL